MPDSTQTNDSAFYPEDAQDKNFAAAREAAQANHEQDLSTRSIGSNAVDEVKTTEATEVINPVADPLGAEKTDEQAAATTPSEAEPASQTPAPSAPAEPAVAEPAAPAPATTEPVSQTPAETK